jgi:4-amino-4-deoxy-L-arabinose transferase-like glycosyltransferase
LIALLRRIPAGVWVALAAAALLLPRLGAFGLWEPWESQLADATAGPAAAWLGLGRALGGSDASLRAAYALAAVAAVAATWWAGVGLFGQRAGLLAAAVLASFPLFALQARQLTSDMPLVLGLALAGGGLGRFAWPAPGVQRRLLSFAVGVLGLSLATFAGGALLGVVVPGAALLGAAALDRPRLPRWGNVLLVATIGAAALVTIAIVAQPHRAGPYDAWLGGIPRPGPSGLTFETLLKQVGFGLFPWSALAFFALAQPLAAPADEPRPARSFLLFFAALGLAGATLRAHLVGPGRFAALAPVALALGNFLDEWIGPSKSNERPPPSLIGLLATVGTIVVARDIFLAPEELVSVHLLDTVKWPVTAGGRGLMLAGGLAFAAALLAAFTVRRWAAWVALALALVMAALLSHVLVPALSVHFSPRTVVGTFLRATGGQPLARFRVEGQEGHALRAVPGPTLATREALVSHLAAPARAFAVIGAEVLAPVDEALQSARVSYAVLDASSSRLLLLVNRLAPGELDQNPLRKHVFLPATPDAKPPWPPPRVPVRAVFAGAVELLGADFPETVHRPGKLPLTLHFRVIARPPPGQGIFVHLELPGQQLVNGDHQPVGGTFPTAHWLPGEYINDQHDVDLPLGVTASGTYRVLVGIWPGGNRPRLPITSGASDGSDRAPLGTVIVK